MKNHVWSLYSNQPSHHCSLISLRCPHEDTLHPWISKMHPVKILTARMHRLSWYVSGRHVRSCVFLTLLKAYIVHYISLWTLGGGVFFFFFFFVFIFVSHCFVCVFSALFCVFGLVLCFWSRFVITSLGKEGTRPRCYNFFLMLNTAEHEICASNKSQNYWQLQILSC